MSRARTSAGEPIELAPVPAEGGADAVAAWAQESAQALVGVATDRAARLRAALEALGRGLVAAREDEALLEALRQRGEPSARGDGAEPPTGEGPGEIALHLWQWREMARTAWAIGAAPEAAVAGLSAQVRHLASALRAKPSRAAEDVRRRLRLPKDAREAVREHEAASARLAEEALDDGRCAAARDSLVAFGQWMKRGWLAPPHVRIIAEALERVERGECRRLIVALPPRSGKSVLVSELFPTWYAGRHPDRDVMLASLSQEKSDDFGRAIRNHIAGEEFARVFRGVHLAGDSTAAARFEVETDPEWGGGRGGRRMRRGVYKCYGRTGRFTGSGANLLVVDDLLGEAEVDSPAANAEAQRAVRALRSRLAPISEGAAWVIVNTRYREDDVIGFVLKEFEADGPWEVLRFPALADEDERVPLPGGGVWQRRRGEPLWPERYSLEEIHALRDTLLRVNPQEWWGQHMCTPIPATGAVVDLGWLRRYGGATEFEAHGARHRSATLDEVRAWGTRVMVTVDTSKGTGSNAARTAVQAWVEVDGRGPRDGAYLVEAWAEAVGYNDQVARVKDFCRRWLPHAALIEDKSTGEVMCQQLPQDRSPDWPRTPIVPISPQGDKLARMAGCTPAMRAGQVWVPERGSSWATWLADWERELSFFPLGRHKDQADATSQFLNWRRVNPAGGASAAGPPPASAELQRRLGGAWVPSGTGRRSW